MIPCSQDILPPLIRSLLADAVRAVGTHLHVVSRPLPAVTFPGRLLHRKVVIHIESDSPGSHVLGIHPVLTGNSLHDDSGRYMLLCVSRSSIRKVASGHFCLEAIAQARPARTATFMNMLFMAVAEPGAPEIRIRYEL